MLQQYWLTQQLNHIELIRSSSLTTDKSLSTLLYQHQLPNFGYKSTWWWQSSWKLLKNRSQCFLFRPICPIVDQSRSIFYFDPKRRGFPTSSSQNSHDNDILMSYDITHEQISVYKQGAVSQLQDFKSHSDRAVSGYSCYVHFSQYKMFKSVLIYLFRSLFKAY